MKHIIPIGLLFGLAHVATAASYTVYSGEAVDLAFSGVEAQFHIPQFDTSLGTLTGVTVKVVASNLTGSFEITNNGIAAMTVDLVTSDYRVRQVTSGLGYTQQTREIDPVETSPQSSPSVTIAPGNSQVFTINPSLGYSISDQSIAAVYFGAYSGSGNVTFGVRNRINISVSGASYTVNSSSSYTTTRMAVQYDYTPTVIPEPSSALLCALGASLGLVRRRRP